LDPNSAANTAGSGALLCTEEVVDAAEVVDEVVPEVGDAVGGMALASYEMNWALEASVTI
jgi:hypothetical protein